MTDDREALIARYQGLRTTDVVDGLHKIGMGGIGLLSHDIRPLWRDVETFKHRLYGYAFTVRFLPTNLTRAEWQERWAAERLKFAGGPQGPGLQKGDIIVIDGEGCGEAGYVGSGNSLHFLRLGAIGVVNSGGCRDTDELIKEKVPIYCRHFCRPNRIGRIQLGAFNEPINCGGALVNPGDVIVADGDGVVVVPRHKAAEVAELARKEAHNDKNARRRLYEQLGIPLDDTVNPDDMA